MTGSDERDSVDIDDDEVALEVGYSECDWESFPEASSEMHDRIIDMDLEELDALDIDALDDLGKWAAAQCYADFELDDRFHDICLKIVRSTQPHVAIEYSEICLMLIDEFLLEGSWDEAVFLLPDVERLVSHDPTIRSRYGAMINLLRGQTDEGLSVYQELADEHDDDGEALLMFACDLFMCNFEAEGLELLDKAHELAMIDGDTELLAEIDEVRTSLDEDEEGADEDEET